MKNVEQSIAENLLILTVDLSQALGDSASGRSTLIANSQRCEIAYNGRRIRVNLTVFEEKKYMPREKETH